MSYFEKTKILSADSPSVDAFFRWRTSSPTTLFDYKPIYDYSNLIWSTLIKGNATESFNKSNASIKLITSGSNSYVARQTRRRFNYQPGKSQFIITTINFSDINLNAIKRVGYFDDNNGIYFEESGSSYGIGLRNNSTGQIVSTFISQSDWNLDKMDGSGPSGINLNWSSSQLLCFDFEWLGVGRVRYGTVHNGCPIYVHEILNSNVIPASQIVYMASPNLPIRYECINSGSSPTELIGICSSVMSEAGYQSPGIIRSADIVTSGSITTNTNINTPIIAIRLKSDGFEQSIYPIQISTQCTNTHRYALLLNPPTSSNFTFTSIDNSAVEFAQGLGGTSLTCSLTNEGTKIISGFVDKTAASITIPIDVELPLGASMDGLSDILVLTIINYGGLTDAQAAITWREVI